MRIIRSASLQTALALLVLLVPRSALAATIAICDANGTTAAMDGAIGAGEYAGFSTGINNGFTGMIGNGVRLYADGDAAGNIAFAIDGTGHQCTWGANDSVVIYIDSTSGGFANTSTFTDVSDPGRAAASGRGTGGGVSQVNFATSFQADYAIVLRNDSASLFQLVSGGAHVIVRSLVRAPADWTTNPCVREATGITFADLGSTGSFHFVATLVNSTNAFRSDELSGSAALAFTQGANTMTLPADGFDVFSMVSSVQTLNATAPFEEHFCAFAGAGFAPTPAAGQLDSDLWRVSGFSDGATTFGGTFAAGPANDFDRAVGTDATTTGGVYAFRQTPAERGLGIQPAGGDFDPGDLDLRLTNAGTTSVVSIALRYNVYYLNNQPRSGTVSFSYSTDGTTFTPVAALDVVTPTTADALGWTLAARTSTITVAVPAGSPLYLRWHHVSSSTGNRDKFAIDDVVVRPTFAVCGNGVPENGEQCDGGASNGTATSCCTAMCGYRPEFTVCGGAASGACDLVDTCDPTGTCVDRVIGPLAPCRVSRGTCDAEEVCDGVSHACPADVRVPMGTLCRLNSGAPCDVTDFCDGMNDACPQTVAMAGVMCASAVPPCDLGSTCDGMGPTCPAHTPAPAATVCRMPAAGGCDVAETCGGALTCPADMLAGAGTVCRMATGLCDHVETCTGMSVMCPADTLLGAGTVCRPASGTCDVAESCSGMAAACPADASAANGTLCDDGMACNGTSTCQSGTCMAGTPPSCGDTNRCTTDACNEPSGACSHTPVAGCCNTAMDCDDTNLCTTDACDVSATCSHTTIAGCCVTAATCDDGDVCTADTCPTPGGSCMASPISGCCHTVADCNDGLSCTTDTCNTTTHTCGHAPIPSCCTVASDCDDSNVCTTDTCGTGGSCGNAPIAGCCRTDGDCGDTDTCTTDTCDTTSHTCTHAPITSCCHAGDSCDDTDFCTDDSCNTTTERCAHTAHSCDDGDACTGDSCSAGACQHAPTCLDGGTDAGFDAAVVEDAGVDAAMATDAGTGGDAGTVVDSGAGDGGRDASATGDGATTRDGGSTTPPVTSTGACGCRVGAPRSPLGLFGLALVLAALWARRRAR